MQSVALLESLVEREDVGRNLECTILMYGLLNPEVGEVASAGCDVFEGGQYLRRGRNEIQVYGLFAREASPQRLSRQSFQKMHLAVEDSRYLLDRSSRYVGGEARDEGRKRKRGELSHLCSERPLMPRHSIARVWR